MARLQFYLLSPNFITEFDQLPVKFLNSECDQVLGLMNFLDQICVLSQFVHFKKKARIDSNVTNDQMSRGLSFI